jgi:hypothetical protein
MSTPRGLVSLLDALNSHTKSSPYTGVLLDFVLVPCTLQGINNAGHSAKAILTLLFGKGVGMGGCPSLQLKGLF